MRILLIAAANKQPAWVEAGFDAYARRFDRRCGLELVTVPLVKRTPTVTVAQAVAGEGRRMLKRVPADAHVVALTEAGEPWSSEDLARRLEGWLARETCVCLLIGGPDGLGSECLARAAACWSLSALTLPHGLVRVIVAESLYRARSLLEGHPYHRG
jgi:23S rRNA (pseudouridine1915-N3)-methyltransferase